MDIQQLADLLRPLERHLDEDPPTLPGFTGFAAVSGARGPVQFIITVDHDGYVGCSLAKRKSAKGPSERCTEANARAFFRFWGLEPAYHEPGESRRVRYYVVRPGKTQ